MVIDATHIEASCVPVEHANLGIIPVTIILFPLLIKSSEYEIRRAGTA